MRIIEIESYTSPLKTVPDVESKQIKHKLHEVRVHSLILGQIRTEGVVQYSLHKADELALSKVWTTCIRKYTCTQQLHYGKTRRKC